MVSSGTSTTPPPSPVSAPRKPAASDPAQTRKVNSATFTLQSAIVSRNRSAGRKTDTPQLLLAQVTPGEASRMTHEKLVKAAVAWLRKYGCGVVLSEQSCA